MKPLSTPKWALYVMVMINLMQEISWSYLLSMFAMTWPNQLTCFVHIEGKWESRDPIFWARTGDAWVNGEVRIGDRWYTHWGARRLKDPTGKRRKLGGFGLGLRRATFRLLHCSICLWASVDRYQKVFHQKQSVDSRALEIERTTLQCRALDIVVAALQPTQCAALWRKTGSTEENINSIVGNN